MTKEKSDSGRLLYIDNLRVLACFLVLLTHSVMPHTGSTHEGFWMYTMSFAGSPSSELFLALSGTVLLPVHTGFRNFYRRRFSKLLPPLIIWSVLGVMLYTYTKGWTWHQAATVILQIPFQPAISVYWFVYVMIGLYLFAPFISPWLTGASRRQIRLFLGIWCVSMMYPWLSHFFPELIARYYLSGSYYWEFCYFGGFLGYWILGYYLNKYPIKIGCNRRWISLCALSILYPTIIISLKFGNSYSPELIDNLQIGSAIAVAMLYTVMQNVRPGKRTQLILSSIAKYSYCIYLTHIFIARELYWGVLDSSGFHVVLRTLITALLTLATGYVLTGIIARIPFGRYVTGTR